MPSIPAAAVLVASARGQSAMHPIDSAITNLLSGLLTTFGGAVLFAASDAAPWQAGGAAASTFGILYIARTLWRDWHRTRMEARRVELASIRVAEFLKQSDSVYAWARAARSVSPRLEDKIGPLPDRPRVPDYFVDPRIVEFPADDAEVTPWRPPARETKAPSDPNSSSAS